jgi:hypothetical protein
MTLLLVTIPFLYSFSCGSAQAVESLGVNRSGWEAIGLSMDVAMALSMP